MTLINLINARKILSQVVSQKMNGNLSYGIMKFIKNSSDDEEFYMSEMNKIIKEYARQDENGEPIKDESGNIMVQEALADECNIKIQELHKTEVKAPWTFNTKDICTTDCFSPQELFVLEPFINE